MPFEDKEICCAECGNTFVFSAQEQELYKQRGYQNEPKRCPPCREARRMRTGGAWAGRSGGGRGGGGGFRSGAQREMHTVICADCGKEAQVPFKPRHDRPVYCSDCFRARR